MTKTAVKITPSGVKLSLLRRAYEGPAEVKLSKSDLKNVRAARDEVAKVIRKDKTLYGINTGFGLLAKTRIDKTKLDKLQKNLVMSHMVGVGKPLPDGIVRLILVLKIVSLAKGYSGVSRDLIKALCNLLEKEVYPVIPEKGSVGASGDLAPLAHLSGVFLGFGKVRHKGRELSAKEGLKKAGLKPYRLGPKEGLALLNGTQVSCALALAALFETEKVFAAALVAGALSLDAVQGTDVPFDARIHEIRRQEGQKKVARVLANLIKGSAIRASHKDCPRVQDPYSLRCQPQVMGACLDQINHAATILLREAEAVSDNPLIFAKNGDVLSGGNFHAEPVALVADIVALVLAEIGNMSERRTALLVDENLSGLPPFLTNEGGLHSGFMMAQVTAAALASENKQKAHPASVDTIPTSGNQEDHVSMATHGARRLLDMAENTASIVAIELLAAAQGIDFQAPLKTSRKLSAVHTAIRKKADFLDEDRPLGPDIDAVRALVDREMFVDKVGDILPSRGKGA